MAQKTAKQIIGLYLYCQLCQKFVNQSFMQSHCTTNNVITDRQAAYLKGDSTISQLLYIIHKIKTNLGKHNITHGIFLDISSAFDKVWHKGLLAKLEQIGISGAVLTMLKSYV